MKLAPWHLYTGGTYNLGYTVVTIFRQNGSNWAPDGGSSHEEFLWVTIKKRVANVFSSDRFQLGQGCPSLFVTKNKTGHLERHTIGKLFLRVRIGQTLIFTKCTFDIMTI